MLIDHVYHLAKFVINGRDIDDFTQNVCCALNENIQEDDHLLMWVQMVSKDTMAYYICEELVLRNTGKVVLQTILLCTLCVIKACIELVECK